MRATSWRRCLRMAPLRLPCLLLAPLWTPQTGEGCCAAGRREPEMCAGTGTAANAGAVSTTPSPATPEQSPPAPVSSAKPVSGHGSKASDTFFTLKRFAETCTKQDKQGWLPIISKQLQVKGGVKSPFEGFQLLKPLQQILQRQGALSLFPRHVCVSPYLLLLPLARMHVIKNALLQPACLPRHLRVQTMAGRQDENLRACANAGCVYLALRQMLLEQAKEGRSCRAKGRSKR